MKLPALLRALRPHQWVKNLFVLAAPFFAWAEQGSFGSGPSLWRTLWAVAAFCLGSSAIYLINDVLDVESDRQHPEKCRRPIAAGEVSVGLALVTSLLCVVLALASAWRAGADAPAVAGLVGSYMLINLFYSLRLKHVVLLDAFCIAAGFLLRVLAGGRAAEAPVSHWILLCTLFLALFLALCKRRAEIDLLGDKRGGHRKILLEYTPVFLDQVIVIVAAGAIFTYTMYTVAEETVEKFHTDALVWTVPFVVFGIFRYLLLVQTQRGGGSPTRVLLGGDLAFVLNGLAWVGTVVLMFFFPGHSGSGH
jgi:4-hydroxybenzoate polyprenyltransferase